MQKSSKSSNREVYGVPVCTLFWKIVKGSPLKRRLLIFWKIPRLGEKESLEKITKSIKTLFIALARVPSQRWFNNNNNTTPPPLYFSPKRTKHSAMENLQPVLFGFTTQQLWGYIHPVALTGWVLLCVAPRWKHTAALTLVPPLLHAVLYAYILLPIMLFPDPLSPTAVDLNDMESVWTILKSPTCSFAGGYII
jgi:hypothetical protein